MLEHANTLQKKSVRHHKNTLEYIYQSQFD